MAMLEKLQAFLAEFTSYDVDELHPRIDRCQRWEVERAPWILPPPRHPETSIPRRVGAALDYALLKHLSSAPDLHFELLGDGACIVPAEELPGVRAAKQRGESVEVLCDLRLKLERIAGHVRAPFAEVEAHQFRCRTHRPRAGITDTAEDHRWMMDAKSGGAIDSIYAATDDDGREEKEHRPRGRHLSTRQEYPAKSAIDVGIEERKYRNSKVTLHTASSST